MKTNDIKDLFTSSIPSAQVILKAWAKTIASHQWLIRTELILTHGAAVPAGLAVRRYIRNQVVITGRTAVIDVSGLLAAQLTLASSR